MSKDIASYFLEQGEPIVPKRKPIYTNYLKTLDTQAAKNTLSPQTINMLKSEFTDKAYQNKELTSTDYYEAIKPQSTEPKLVDGRIEFAGGGTDYWAMVTRMFIEAGSEKGTGMNIKDFAAQYFPREGNAEGGRIGFQEGKLAQLGNIADVRNIPYYASKTVEGAVNAGEVLSKLPFAVGDLASKLLREKPSKEMFLSSLKNIQPGTWSDAIGLSELVTRQEEDLSPEVKTMGSQLSLTSETFIPVGTAIKLGDKIIKNASKQLGKVDDNKTLEQVIDKRLSDYGESRRDFNKIVASTGMMAGLKALGLSSIKPG